MLQRLAAMLTRWSTRWVPDSWVIAVLLTLLTMGLAIGLTDKGPAQVADAWGAGLWELLSFSMQMALVVVTGYILAITPFFRRQMERLATVANGPRSAVALMAAVSMGLAWLNWGLSLIGSAVFAKTLARRIPTVDYRLLVTCAYLGLGTMWHAGLSASAPLLVATKGHFLEKQIGVIPATETLFHPFNLSLSLIVGVVMVALAVAIHPAQAEPFVLADEPSADVVEATAERTPAQWLETAPVMNLAIGGLGLWWILQALATKGLGAINLNLINLLFLSLGVLVHGTPRRFLKAAEEATQNVWGILIQFPLYGGMYGIIKESGLQDMLSHWLATAASPAMYPLFVTWYSGILNYLIPSGGAKWAIEAPYVLQAAQTIGASVPATIMAYAWGDMLTDLIQPFWAIPLLGLARLQFRDILGYAMIFFAVYAAIVTAVFASASWWFA